MGKNMRVSSDDRDENEIDLTPMLDVVFIMLIFFIVTATFIRETGLEANRSAEPLMVQPISEAILITIDADDKLSIAGQAVDPRSMRAHIERLHAENSDWPVVIDPNPASTTKMLVAAMDAARASDIPNISIAGSD
jgi:biopolymer transport protein ExbD